MVEAGIRVEGQGRSRQRQSRVEEEEELRGGLWEEG